MDHDIAILDLKLTLQKSIMYVYVCYFRFMLCLKLSKHHYIVMVGLWAFPTKFLDHNTLPCIGLYNRNRCLEIASRLFSLESCIVCIVHPTA